jgi:hypothetical protein
MRAADRFLGPQLSGSNLKLAGDHNQRVTLHAIRVNGPAHLPAVAPVVRADAPAVGAAILPFTHSLLPARFALLKRD